MKVEKNLAVDLYNLQSEVEILMKKVGNYQLKTFNESMEISSKSNKNDLVTNADKESEERIVSFIKEKFLTHSILSEEGGDRAMDSKYRWIIDPIDGTNNYAHGLPIFTISIALEKDGEIVLGCVYNPSLKEFFHAIKGKGAFLNNEKIHVSSQQDLSKALLATGFPYDKLNNPNNNLDNFSRIVPNIRGVRRTGSAAYDLCNVARGTFDGFWELRLNLWDIAAAKLIIEEAGGKVNLYQRDNGINIVAANSDLIAQLLNILNKDDFMESYE
ncbi:MAG: inositol monophosphatase family protein [Halanaerobiales bacterium]